MSRTMLAAAKNRLMPDSGIEPAHPSGPEIFKLRRLRRAWARAKILSATNDLSSDWCPGPELNRHAPFRARDFKSRASASFATRA
jgi:hypothetical protein